MKTIGRAALPNPSQLILNWLALLCVCVFPLSAQNPSTPAAPAAVSTASALPAGLHSVTTLDGGWRFREGDDPQWADPGFNDSDWQPVSLGEPLSTQGLDPYSGFAWYRIRLQPQIVSQLGGPPESRQPTLLVTGNSVGQIAVYINGVESGHTRGMAEQLAEYQSTPFLVPVSGSGPIDIAIRTWAGPTVTIGRGLLDKVELGPRDEMADRLALAVGRQWNEYATSALILAFIFLCVALLGGALYLAQRNHSEYLWLAILCVVYCHRPVGTCRVWTGADFPAGVSRFEHLRGLHLRGSHHRICIALYRQPGPPRRQGGATRSTARSIRAIHTIANRRGRNLAFSRGSILRFWSR